MSEPYAMQKVDPDTARLAGDCAAQVAVELGESPEAWRGAAVLGHFMKCVVMADIDACRDATGAFEITEVALTQLLTVGMLEAMPMWPPDVSGDPLIVDDGPSDYRPHFRAAPDA